MTQKLMISMPEMKNVVPDPNAYPLNYRYPPIAVIREAVKASSREDADVSVPGYGVVTVREDAGYLDLSYLPIHGDPFHVRWTK